ncbi:hypothetical protein NDU88_000805 [Pleurodeles waltl]|uniref:Uncharacterized protein n=1 Tax=Pleurodeles waltl TaxID=8319 RepID=A0AAV7WKI1_PLEWA|nr:hypothetical protein NDU88_000805 [Pleurodeles waltl]
MWTVPRIGATQPGTACGIEAASLFLAPPEWRTPADPRGGVLPLVNVAGYRWALEESRLEYKGPMKHGRSGNRGRKAQGKPVNLKIEAIKIEAIKTEILPEKL